MLYECNYRCSYCFFEGKWEEYGKRSKYFTPDELFSYWKGVREKYGPPYLIITGGEPFLYPHFIKIIKGLLDICYHINISSNSSGDLEKFVTEIDYRKVSLSLSFQPEFEDLDNFITKLLLVRRNNFNGCINFVAYPPFLKNLNYYKEKFLFINEQLKIIPFFGEYQGISYPQGYTQGEKELIGIDDKWFSSVRRKGTLCPAGQKTALVFPDGKVARCGRMGEDTLLGNFFDRDFKLLDAPSPCEAEYCPCAEGEPDPVDNQDRALTTGQAETGNKIIEKPQAHEHPCVKGIYFTWDIHYKCNFRCPYCWFYSRWPEEAKKNIYLSAQEWMKHWGNVHDKYGEVRIEITGGEPFIYPDFIRLVKLLSSIHIIKITNNMSGDIETFVREIDPRRVTLDLNFHPLFADIDPFIKKTLLLKKNGFKTGVCYLAYPPQMGRIGMFKKRFEDEGINFALAAFWGEYRGKKYPESYTREEIEMIRPLLGDIERTVYHLNGESPKGRLCNAGHKYAVIRGDGNVVRCGQLPDRIITSLLDKNFHLLDMPEPCEASYCPCNEYGNLVEMKRKGTDKD
jgi:organic radical activating enzyme